MNHLMNAKIDISIPVRRFIDACINTTNQNSENSRKRSKKNNPDGENGRNAHKPVSPSKNNSKIRNFKFWMDELYENVMDVCSGSLTN